MKQCKLCLLPSKVPSADIDSKGICSYCRQTINCNKERLADDQMRAERRIKLEEVLNDNRGKSAYDVLVCLSGGKDSLYLLYELKVKYKLKVLAYTTDINIPEVAWSNILITIKKLDIDHLIYRPSPKFYQKLFRYLLMNQEERGAVYTVSYVYAPLFEGDALKVAMERGIPLVLAGYSPGQPDPSRMEFEFSRNFITQIDWTPPALRQSGQFSEEELSRFWNPKRFSPGTQFPRYIAPFHAWDYDQEAMIRKVHELGLVKRQAHGNPIHSNYPINWLLMYSDLKHFGYNPYAPEFSALIRKRKANRLYWRVMTPIVNSMIRNKLLLGRNITRQLSWLGLSESDLRITQPFGAYDPKID